MGTVVAIVGRTLLDSHGDITLPRAVLPDRGAICRAVVQIDLEMRGLVRRRKPATPVMFDARHSVQLEGEQGMSADRHCDSLLVLDRVAVAIDLADVINESHPHPASAIYDGTNASPFGRMKAVLERPFTLPRLAKAPATRKQLLLPIPQLVRLLH